MAQRRRSVARTSHRLAWLAAFALAALLAPGPAAARGSGDARPVIAIVADNAGTEVTDFLVPYGVLSDSGAADVIAVSTRPGPVVLMPSNLLIQAERTLESFDQEHPEGADYVVVPALHERDQPEVVAWLRAQGEKGATLFSICDGAWTLAATGRLDGRMATTHWYSRGDIAAKYPKTQWRDDRRYIHDRDVITTTGVSASIPASLYVVQLLAGPERAEALAKELGVAGFSDAHDGAGLHADRRPCRHRRHQLPGLLALGADRRGGRAARGRGRLRTFDGRALAHLPHQRRRGGEAARSGADAIRADARGAGAERRAGPGVGGAGGAGGCAGGADAGSAARGDRDALRGRAPRTSRRCSWSMRGSGRPQGDRCGERSASS